MDRDHPDGLSRREVIGTTAAAAAAVATPAIALSATPREHRAVEPLPSVAVSFAVNGEQTTLSLDPRTTLLDAAREHLRLTGSKKGCDHGQCGACTMIVNGRRINSCLTLAVMHDGETITTIEGLGTLDRLHSMQAAFVARGGFQCGYCTPGQICSSVAMLGEIAQGIPSHITTDLDAVVFSDHEVRERMSGNICRCAAYPHIVAAVRDVHEIHGA